MRPPKDADLPEFWIDFPKMQPVASFRFIRNCLEITGRREARFLQGDFSFPISLVSDLAI